MWTDNRDRYSHSLSDSVGFQNSAADLHTALFPSLTNNNCENNMKDLQPLQGLRAVCAMAIVLGHQNEFFLTPMIGVEYLQAVNIFFLLSGLGLTIGRLYTHRRNNPNNDTTTVTNGDGTGTTNTPSVGSSQDEDFSLETWTDSKRFWRKRAARILPIYYLSLICMYLLQCLTTQPRLHSPSTGALNNDETCHNTPITVFDVAPGNDSDNGNNDDPWLVWKSFGPSLLACAMLLQGWLINLVAVSGHLWQIAHFAWGYALFPFVVAVRAQTWKSSSSL